MTNTSQEHFDIVDEYDNLLGITKPRDIVHKELTDWHRVTGIFILNDHMQLLCQQRSLKKDVHPGIWQCFFGGHLKVGQTYDHNAIEELQEELGLHLNISDLQFLGKITNDKHKHHVGIYVYRWNGSPEQLHFNDGEVEKVQWMGLEEYAQLQTRETNAPAQYNELFIQYINNTYTLAESQQVAPTEAAGGIVINNEGKVAVVSQHGTSWSLPKGGIENGEDILEAAKREVYEETGVSELELIKSLGHFTRSGISRYGSPYAKRIHIFLFKTNQKDAKPIDPDNPEVLWLDKNYVAEKLSFKEDKQFFESIKDTL